VRALHASVKQFNVPFVLEPLAIQTLLHDDFRPRTQQCGQVVIPGLESFAVGPISLVCPGQERAEHAAEPPEKIASAAAAKASVRR